MSSLSLQSSILDRLSSAHPEAVATELEQVSAARRLDVVAKLSAVSVAALLPWLTPGSAAQCMDKLGDGRSRDALMLLDPLYSSSLLSRLPPARRDVLLSLLPGSDAAQIRLLLTYPRESSASIMDPRVVSVRPQSTASAALRRVKARGLPIQQVVVVDAANKPAGRVLVSELALAPPDALVQKLMIEDPTAVPALTPIEDAVNLFKVQGLTTLPVVDAQNRLIGVLRQDHLSKAAADDAAADLATMVGAGADEKALSGVGFSVSRRLPWLGINLLTAFLASAVVGIFEDLIARVSALAVLLPVVAGQSGNTGAQAMAVAMRGLAVREILPRHWWKVVFKEIQVGLINGAAIALVTGLSVWWWSQSWMLGAVIAASMVLAMGIASAAGALVPILLAAMGRDPAQSSSIILTTVTDVFGFLSFLGLATLALKNFGG